MRRLKKADLAHALEKDYKPAPVYQQTRRMVRAGFLVEAVGVVALADELKEP